MVNSISILELELIIKKNEIGIENLYCYLEILHITYFIYNIYFSNHH